MQRFGYCRAAPLTVFMANTFSINRKNVGKLLEDYQKLNDAMDLGDGAYQDVYRFELAKLTIENLAEILESAFDASLRQEEGKHHRFSIVVSPPEAVFAQLKSPHTGNHHHGSFSDVFSFVSPIEINKLAKYAPAFENTNRKMRVWFNDDNKIVIWGAATSSYFDYRGLEISAFAAGQLLIQRELPSPAFPRQLLTFSHLERITRTSPLFQLLRDKPFSTVEHAKPNLILAAHFRRLYGLFIDIVNRMSAHGHGGTLLVVPNGFKLEASLDCPTRPSREYTFIEEMLRRDGKEDEFAVSRRDPSHYTKDSNFIAQLTAIDGASVITKELAVLAIGSKIRSSDVPSQIFIQNPFQTEQETTAFNGAKGKLSNLEGLGGTRHQSAARFVYENRKLNAFAIVASQDGRVSIIYHDNMGAIISFQHAEYFYYGVKI